MKELKDRIELLTLFPKCGVGAELGVERGNFSEQLLEKAMPRELWLIDAWRHLPGEYENDPVDHDDETFERMYQRIAKKYSGHMRVNVLRSLIEDAAAKFPDDYFDWIYLDADHSAEAVKRHLQLWIPKVKEGGIIAGHDYYNTGNFPWIHVKEAVDELFTPDVITMEECGSWLKYKDDTL